MPEGASGAVTDPTPPEGSPSGSPAGAGGGGTEETVPAARFNGLMSEFNKVQQKLKDTEARVEALSKAPEPPAAPVTPAVDIDAIVAQAKDAARQESVAALSVVKRTAVDTLLNEFPYARPEDVTGNSLDDWRASAKAAHERVAAIVDNEKKGVVEEAKRRAAQEFGVPLFLEGEDVTPEGAAEAHTKAVDAARKSGDAAELARLLLLGGS